MSSIYDWSLFAANNANADDIINWAEGQPPGSVNNSARAMMQRVRELLSDLGGVARATGAANTLAVQIKSPVTAYVEGLRVLFRAAAVNSGQTTLNVNNIGARQVYRMHYSGLAPLSGGELQARGIYEAVYSGDMSNNAGAWLLLNPTDEQSIPAGAVQAFAMRQAPKGWLACDGRAVARKDFPNLFAAISTDYGAGDGATTFNVPDYRGMFLRGWDSGRGIDSGRQFAKRQDSANRRHSHSGSRLGWAGGHAHRTGITVGAIRPLTNEGWQVMRPGGETWSDEAGGHVHELVIQEDGEHEARPVNLAVLYAIRF